MTLSFRSSKRPLAAFLAALILMPPAVQAQAVAESGAAIEAFTIGDVVPSLPAAAVGVGASNAVKTRSAPVSARGTFSTGIAIQVPAGRLGMTPALSLAYDSGAFRRDSSVGAGWGLSVPRISRSAVSGFPKLKRTSNGFTYDDAAARFDAGGSELAPLPADAAAPTRAFADGALYVPLREAAAIVFEYSSAQDAWVEHRPDGRKGYYGLEGSRKARIRTELGSFAWLLLKETDQFDNGIRYEYRFIAQQDRADKFHLQQEPVLSLVSWGGNGTGEPDPFRVVINATPTPIAGADLLRGNTQTTGTVSSIVVCGSHQSFTRAASSPFQLRAPSASCPESLYWTYDLTYQDSADTGRKLLTRVTRTNPWGDPERIWTMTYQGNGGKVHFDAPQPIVKGGDPKDLLLFTRYGNRLSLPLNSPDRAVNPPETSIATRLLDLDHDGRSDVVYLPSGVAAAEAGILREGSIDSPRVDLDEFARSRLRQSDGGWAAFDLASVGFKEHRYLPSGRFRYSDLADVNGDGRVDAVFFNALTGDGFPRSRRREPCFSEAFWRRCGVIDPPSGDICRLTDVCQQQSELDMSMCANGSCWITPADLRRLFSDWADWSRTPPSSERGQSVLRRHGALIDLQASLISVPAARLRLKLKIRTAAVRAVLAMSTAGTCAGMMGLCMGGSIDGIPAPRIGDRFDATLFKLGAKDYGSGEMRVLPPVYRMNYHAGGGSPGAIAPTIPLYGWPSGVYKMTVLHERSDPGPQEWTARSGADFSAPLVDVNADGFADLVLLKSTEVTIASAIRPSTEFTPRAFLSRHTEPPANGLPDVAMDLDWKSFQDQYPEAAGEGTPRSDFTQSLQDILIKPGAPYTNTIDDVEDSERTYPVGPSYNSFLLDVNGDGLPDLVAAVPDAPGGCPGSGLARHDVFLNRGYRFGVPAAGTVPGRPSPAPPFAFGPFEVLLKRDLGGADAPPGCPALVLGNHLPMAASSFTDINGDGRVDVVFQWHELGSPSVSRRVFLNKGTSFEPMSSSAANAYGLPAIPLAEVAAERPRGFAVGDLARFEDVDDDGLVDVVAAGTFCLEADRQCAPFVHPDMPGAMDPSRWQNVGDYKVLPAFFYRNTGKVPDLLTRVEQSSGAFTAVTYAAGRLGPVASSWVPPGLVVTSEVTRAASPTASQERVRLAYENYVKTVESPEALGFERVIATFEDRDGATVTGTLKQTRVFDVRAHVDGVSLAHPGKGLELETIAEADGRRESESLAFSFQPFGKGVRIRPSQSESSSCRLLTDGSCDPADHVGTRTAIQARDELGFATDTLSGDLHDGEISATDRIRVLSTYDHRVGPWILGNRTSETVRGRAIALDGTVTADAQLSYWTATYDDHAALTTLERPAITPASCQSAVPAASALTEILSYDGRGLPTKVRINRARTATLTYDSHHLYPLEHSVTVDRFVDGAPQPGETTLTSRVEVDLRTREVWATRDPNGAVVETQRDSFGRLTSAYDAKGTRVERHAYEDATPVRHRRWLMTSAAGNGRLVDVRLDGRGAVLARFDSTWSGGQASATVRKDAVEYDSAGNALRQYLPVATTAMPGPSEPRIVRQFDAFGSLKREQSPDTTAQGRVTTMTYGPRRMVSVDPRGTTTTRLSDWQGATIRLDRTGGTDSLSVRYERDGLGQLTGLFDADGAVRRFEYDAGGRVHRYTLPHSQAAPASGPFELCFDPGGMLAASIDPVGARVQVRYDRLGRPVSRDVAVEGSASPARYTYSYDSPEPVRKAMGRLWRTTGPAASTEIAYDPRGFAVEGRFFPQAAALGGADWPAIVTTKASYGLQGELRDVSYFVGSGEGIPAGSFVYDRDAQGRLARVRAGTEVLAGGFHYDAFQRMDKATIGGLSAEWEWAPESQYLTRIEYTQAGVSLVRILRDGFDKGGNPGKETRTGQSSSVDKVHAFDGLGRLKSSSIKVGDALLKDERFDYSPGGRLLQAGSDAYAYEKPALWGAVTAVGSRTFEVDARGNVVADSAGNRRLRYDAQGCTIAMESAGGGRVVSLCDGAGNHIYRAARSESGSSSRVLSVDLSEIRPDDGILLHRLPLNGTISLEVAHRLSDGARVDARSRAVLLDSRGSVVATAPLGGTDVAQAGDYDAWGNPVAVGAVETPGHGFVGGEPDAAFGTYAYGRRVFDPSLRRWLAADPTVRLAPELDAERGLQLDLYGYAANNPVALTDTSGAYVDDFAFSLIPMVGPANDAGLALERALIAHENGDDVTAASQGCLAFSNTLFAIVDAATLGTAGLARDAAVLASKAVLQAEAKNVPRAIAQGAVAAPEAGSALPQAAAAGPEAAATARPPVPDDALVVRGGTSTADSFRKPGEFDPATGKLTSASVQSAPGKSVEELARGLPHNKVGVAKESEVRKAGGDVKPTPTPDNPDHCDLCGLTPEQAEKLFKVMPNPAKPPKGQK
jgi:RHS repeat-associated protein